MSGLILPGGGPLPLGAELVGQDGPIPPSRLTARLKEISDRLNVTWHPFMKKWSVTEEWHSNDKRWQLHREGLVGAPMDVVCFLPEGQDPDTVGDYIVEQVHKCDLSKSAGQRKLINRIRDMQEHNRQVNEKHRLAAMEPILEEIKYQSRYILDKRHTGKLAKKHNVTVKYRR